MMEIMIRLGLSVLTGLLVGIERERHHRPAGIKTHIMVCLGATVISLIQVEMIEQVIRQVRDEPLLANVLKSDYGRLGAQVISGIGFLGAGTILHNKGAVKGLTTAATLWIVACLGLAIGMGYYVISVVSLMTIMGALIGLRLFQKALENRRGTKRLEFYFIHKGQTLTVINEYFAAKYIAVKYISFPEHEEAVWNGHHVHRCIYTISLPRAEELKSILMYFSMENNIVRVFETAEDE